MANQYNVPLKSDALFKKVFSSEMGAYEFLDAYLPTSLKNKLDISKAKIEKESYVEENLKRQLSDIVYSVPYKNTNNKKIFVYILLEHQSSPDRWIALRLWKYILLLCERHKEKNQTFPVVAPFVIYNGKKKYNAPRSFWKLFDDSKLAKEMMGDEYILIDLNSMSEEEIKQKPHLGSIEFFMKNIYGNKAIDLWRKFFKEFDELIICDKNYGLVYIKLLLWYTGDRIADEDKSAINSMLLEYFDDEGEKTMRTMADSWREEGLLRGIQEGLKKGIEEGLQKGLEEGRIKGMKQGVEQGIERGIERGIEQGIEQGIKRGAYLRSIEIARAMLAKNKPISEIHEFTGLSQKEILSLAISEKS